MWYILQLANYSKLFLHVFPTTLQNTAMNLKQGVSIIGWHDNTAVGSNLL